MKELPFEKSALMDKETPPGLDLADACYYNGLRLIFKAYKQKVIDKAEGAKIKEELYRRYVTEKSKSEFLSREVLSLSERISKASEAYREAPSLETAEELYRAFYNIKSADEKEDSGKNLTAT